MYNALREAELRAHLWVFSTRKTALYPICMTTMQVVPPTWNATEIYPFAALVVSAIDGRVYQSSINANQNNAPEGGTPYWDIFFGSLNVNVWGQFPGLQSPVTPWSDSVTYPANAFVTYNGNLYVSNYNGNLGYEPDTNQAWWMWQGAPPGPGQETGYFANDLVYFPAASNYQIFLSLQNGNNVQPGGGIPAYSAATTYNPGDQVTYSSAAYESNLPINFNNTPESSPILWLATTTYADDDTVIFYDGQKYNIYTSAAGSNTGNPPLLDGVVNSAWWTYTSTPYWISVPSQELASSQEYWLLLEDSTLEPLRIPYPIGSGPVEDQDTRNVFQLPNGYLREAPQDPKAGSFSPLGAPTNLMYDDWTFENGMFTSWWPAPIVFRFCADVCNPNSFDALFAEGLGARMAEELAEPLTQSTAKKQIAQADYKQYMGQASRTNAIEAQPVEFPLDDWIAARI
jgi:hypothetical protein